MSEITIEKLDEQLKAIDAEFRKVTKMWVELRDERVRLKGEADALAKIKKELEKKDVSVDDKQEQPNGD